ncbi:hypothetical protein BDV95DRAFT_591040 [Massariosphaeria phaeospora]|uniref:Uncharacterized protein n=1 Tax=Massariosphaeria phaeospora TaxID=100035 RepID=A0A7C8MFC4_9PLEO|nr:hypothetical protein BDV95DRAFT_591040 [Massariosphaeria phaeospora]
MSEYTTSPKSGLSEVQFFINDAAFGPPSDSDTLFSGEMEDFELDPRDMKLLWAEKKAADLEAKVRELEKKNQELEKENKSLNSKAQEYESLELIKTQMLLSWAETSNTKLQQEHSELKTEIVKLDDGHKGLEKKVKELTSTTSQLQEEVRHAKVAVKEKQTFTTMQLKKEHKAVKKEKDELVKKIAGVKHEIVSTIVQADVVTEGFGDVAASVNVLEKDKDEHILEHWCRVKDILLSHHKAQVSVQKRTFGGRERMSGYFSRT